MQVDLRKNGLEKHTDVMLLLKSAAQATNCKLILVDTDLNSSDPDKEGEETVESQEGEEGEEVEKEELQALEGQNGRVMTTVMPPGAVTGAPAPAPWPASASVLTPAPVQAPASISAPNQCGTSTTDTVRPHMKQPLSPRVSLVGLAALRRRFESPSATPSADYDA